MKSILSPGATISPYIPRSFPLLFSPFSDLFTSDALIFSVIPFSNVLCDLYLGLCTYALVRMAPSLFPREFISAAKF
jgi:hypothetical protein